MRRAAKVDFNHAEIVKALRQAGCCVLDLSAVGHGCPDLLVTEPAYPFDSLLVEIKNGANAPSQRRLTPDQIKFHGKWKGRIAIVESVDDALRAVRVLV